MRKRQGQAISAGFARAKAAGEHIGRKRAVLYGGIYRLRDEGMSLQKIADEMQCSRGSVQHALRVKKLASTPKSGDE